MQRAWFVLGMAAVLAGPALPAQQRVEPVCEARLDSDPCQKSIDLFRYLNTQFGTLIAGGNATLGQGGSLGGLGHVSFGVRVNMLQASVPVVSGVAASADVAGPPPTAHYPTTSKYVAFPEVDAAVGLFRGFPIGLTYIGGVDGLLSASYLPSFEAGGMSVSNSVGVVRFGFGGRIGVLQETMLTPGISVSYFERRLPKATIGATVSPTETYDIQGVDLSAKSWRVVASKTILGFGLAAGFGRDYYNASARISYNVEGFVPPAPINAGASSTRTNIFGDLSVNLIPLIKFVGEVGRVSGGSVVTYNTFDRNANDARWYGSIGARLVF